MPEERRRPPLFKAIAKAASEARPNRRRRAGMSGDGVTLAFTIIIAAAAMRLLSGFSTALGGVPQAAQVGDRLTFTPAPASAPAPVLAAIPVRVVTGPWAPPGRGCVLDTAVMARPGGAMTVLAVRPDGVMLSWAGGATANGPAACHGGQIVLVADDAYRDLQKTQTPRLTAK